MKRLLTALVVVLAVVGPRWAYAEDVRRTDSDIVSFEYKGSSVEALAISSGGVIYSEEGITNVRESYTHIPIVSTTSILDLTITTTSLTAGATYFSGQVSANATFNRITQPRHPTPLVFNMWFNVGSATYTWNSTATVSGIDSLGSSRTVNITVSTNVSRTSPAFTYISSITIGVFSSTVVYNNVFAHITVGSTNFIGLANDIVNQDDVYAYWENGARISSATVDADGNTIRTQNVPSFDITNSSFSFYRPNIYEFQYRVRQSPPRRVHPNRTNITP